MKRTINQDTYEAIKNLLELNPSLVFNFLDVFDTFPYTAWNDSEDEYKDDYKPLVNKREIMLKTNDIDIIGKYMNGRKDYSFTQIKMIADSFIECLKNIVVFKENNKQTEDLEFLESIYNMTRSELTSAFNIMSEEDKKEFKDRLLSLVFSKNEEDVINMIRDDNLFMLCATNILMASAANIISSKDIFEASLKGENLPMVIRLAGLYDYDDYLKLVENEPKNPKGICALTYAFGSGLESNGFTMDADLYKYAEESGNIYKFIDEMHTYDIRDFYTSNLVKKYLLKKDQKLR